MLRCWSRCPPPLMLLPRLGRRCWHRRPPLLVPRLTRPPREALQPRPAVLHQSATATAAATARATDATGPTASYECPSPTSATATGCPPRRAANPAMRHVATASATLSAAASCPTPTSDRAPTPADLSKTATWEAEHATSSIIHSSILLIARPPTSLWPLFVFSLRSVRLLAVTSLRFLGHSLKSRVPTSPLRHPSLILSSTFWHPITCRSSRRARGRALRRRCPTASGRASHWQRWDSSVSHGPPSRLTKKPASMKTRSRSSLPTAANCAARSCSPSRPGTPAA